MILAVAGTKGGGGKTTLAINLAVERAQSTSVLLIDGDEQGTSKIWASVREENEIIPAVPCLHFIGRPLETQKQIRAVFQELEALAQQYGDLIIDVGGRNTDELRAVFTVADRVVFPVKPSGADVWALAQTEALFAEAKVHNPGVTGSVVVNLASTNPPRSEAEDLEELFADFAELEYSGIVLRNRVSYTRALNDGLGVTEYRPRDAKAQSEVQTLFNYLYNG